MRIAFLDHAYHIKTRSTIFMIKFLRNYGVVDIYYDYTYRDGGKCYIDNIISGKYDLVVVFQMSTPAVHLAKKIGRRLIFVAMYDGSCNLSDECWRELRGARILNFSKTLHDHVTKLGLNSRYVKYFPRPVRIDSSTSPRGLRGFFWQRSDEIAWSSIRKLIGDTAFAQFNLHQARDPDAGDPAVPAPQDTIALNLTTTDWFESQSDFQDVLSRANVFFASRAVEGIGLSFLEAMARGQCVVAPNAATMSEYIEHGVNGLLYDHNAPAALDFSRAAEMGWVAQISIAEGYGQWQRDLEDTLPKFLFPSRRSICTVVRGVVDKKREMALR